MLLCEQQIATCYILRRGGLSMELEYLDLSEVELDIAAVDSKKGESEIKINWYFV